MTGGIVPWHVLGTHEISLLIFALPHNIHSPFLAFLTVSQIILGNSLPSVVCSLDGMANSGACLLWKPKRADVGWDPYIREQAPSIRGS